jgi:hypothetical protein
MLARYDGNLKIQPNDGLVNAPIEKNGLEVKKKDFGIW